MTIDLNAYLGHWPFRRLRHNTADGLLALMDRAQIDIACVSSASAIFYKNSQAGNEELAEQVAGHEDRLVPFAVINPSYIDWEHDLRVCVEDFGARGLRLYPNYHNYGLRDSCLAELVSAATEHDLVVSFPVRQIDQRQRHWLLHIADLSLGELEALVERHPDAKFAFLNGLGFTNSRLGQADSGLPGNYVMGISRMWALMTNEVGVLIESVGVERLVFGSGMPFKYPEVPNVKLAAMDATEEQKEAIRSGNARRLLGMQ